jgi:hypothetical protein
LMKSDLLTTLLEKNWTCKVSSCRHVGSQPLAKYLEQFDFSLAEAAGASGNRP